MLDLSNPNNGEKIMPSLSKADMIICTILYEYNSVAYWKKNGSWELRYVLSNKCATRKCSEPLSLIEKLHLKPHICVQNPLGIMKWNMTTSCVINFQTKTKGEGSLINIWKTNWKFRPTVMDDWLRITSNYHVACEVHCWDLVLKRRHQICKSQ